MRRLISLCGLAVVASLAGALLVACGGEEGSAADSERDQIATAFEKISDAVKANDPDLACQLMGSAARTQLDATVSSTTPQCAGGLAQILPGLSRWLRTSGSAGRPKIEATRLEQSAIVTITVDGRDVRVPFVKKGGQWRLDSFYGLEPIPSPAL